MYKVLVIDDEPWSREVVRSLGNWRKHDMDIVGEAEDGNEGMALAKSLKPEVIVTDMRMPGLEGDALLRALGGLCPVPKIIVMSGYEDFAYLKQAIQSKAINYLLKPIDPVEMEASLQQCRHELDACTLSSMTIFNEKAAMERYLAYLQQISELLLEHNRRGMSAAMERLETFLSDHFSQNPNPAILKKVGYDLLLILYEFEAEKNITGSSRSSAVLEQELENGWAVVGEAVLDFSMLLFKAMQDSDSPVNSGRIDLAEVQQYIEHHFTESISLESVAQHFYASREYLSRAFKIFTGENMSDYITRKRMEKAHMLILQKRYEFKNIAKIVGYEDTAYFYRVFKKYYGCAPGKLRS